MNASEVLMIINVVLTSISIVVIPLLNLCLNSHILRDVKLSKCCFGHIEFDKAAKEEERKLIKTTSDLILNKK